MDDKNRKVRGEDWHRKTSATNAELIAESFDGRIIMLSECLIMKADRTELDTIRMTEDMSFTPSLGPLSQFIPPVAICSRQKEYSDAAFSKFFDRVISSAGNARSND